MTVLLGDAWPQSLDWAPPVITMGGPIHYYGRPHSLLWGAGVGCLIASPSRRLEGRWRCVSRLAMGEYP